jgi:hypothetical protein
MKARTTLLFLCSVVLILLFTAAFLYIQNRSYSKENRELLLRNDSIAAANIELKDSISKAARPTVNGVHKVAMVK